jgi:hypothetical protein
VNASGEPTDTSMLLDVILRATQMGMDVAFRRKEYVEVKTLRISVRRLSDEARVDRVIPWSLIGRAAHLDNAWLAAEITDMIQKLEDAQ